MLQVISSTSNTSETLKHTKNLCALVILMRWQRKLLSCSSKGDFKWLHSDSLNSLRPRQHLSKLPASRCSSMNSKHEKWRCHCLAVTNYTSVWWQPGNVLNPKGFQEHRTISSSLKMNSQLLKSTEVMCTPSQTASTYHSWPRPRRCRSPSHRHISRRLGYTGLSRRHS